MVVKCAKCDRELGSLDRKRELDGNIYCIDCYKKITQDTEEKKKYEKQKQKNKEKLKKILEINSKWEYKILQIPTIRGAFVATSAKIHEDIEKK